MALHFNRLPTQLTPDEANNYLFFLQKKFPSPSLAYFKFTVYGLRYLLRCEHLPYSHLHLPKIARDRKLPVILSKREIWSMLKSTKQFKHRLLIGLIYGCGLRCMEVRALRVSDIQFDRKQLHIVQSKGKRDRYVPLSDHLIRGLKKYISQYDLVHLLFPGNIGVRSSFPFQGRSILSIVKEAATRAGINKNVHTHTLRHCYATHLLEDGINLMVLKDLLGHSSIETTLLYLRISSVESKKVKSPIDSLFEEYGPKKMLHPHPLPDSSYYFSYAESTI